jgi:glycosyltransferase involved in cell wall biosynthesis
LIVGDGRQAAWIREQIEARGLQHTVFMLGRHPLERMPEFFKGADALIVSLRAEPIFAMTIPGKVSAYLSAGRP